jgi:predicted transcriptional regulator/protein-tyrosine-phosphatase
MPYKKITTVKQVQSSSYLKDILESLTEGIKTNTELQSIIKSHPKRKSHPKQIYTPEKEKERLDINVRHATDQYIASDFVEKFGNSFQLAPFGKIFLSKYENGDYKALELQKVLSAISSLNQQFDDFWSKHYIRGIPESSLRSIEDIFGGDSKIIRNGEFIGIDTVKENYYQNLKKAKKIFIASPLTDVIQINHYIERLDGGVIIEFVNTNDVSEIAFTNEYKDIKMRIINHPNSRPRISKDDFLFSWSENQEYDSDGLKNFLKKNYSIDMLRIDRDKETADLKIILSNEKILTLSLYKETRVYLKFDNHLIDVFIAKKNGNNLSIYTNNLKIGLTVTDNFLSLGLYHKNEYYEPSYKGYDGRTDLFSTNQKTIEWGRKLFDYYKIISIPDPSRVETPALVASTCNVTVSKKEKDIIKRSDEKMIIFVSGGGTCRCAMAKAMTKKLVEKEPLNFNLRVESRGIGPKISPGGPPGTKDDGGASDGARQSIQKLFGEDLLSLDNHIAMILDDAEIEEADLILFMDEGLSGIFRKQNQDKPNTLNKTKIFKEFFGKGGNIIDPWGEKEFIDINETPAERKERYERYDKCAAEIKELLDIKQIISFLSGPTSTVEKSHSSEMSTILAPKQPIRNNPKLSEKLIQWCLQQILDDRWDGKLLGAWGKKYPDFVRFIFEDDTNLGDESITKTSQILQALVTFQKNSLEPNIVDFKTCFEDSQKYLLSRRNDGIGDFGLYNRTARQAERKFHLRHTAYAIIGLTHIGGNSEVVLTTLKLINEELNRIDLKIERAVDLSVLHFVFSSDLLREKISEIIPETETKSWINRIEAELIINFNKTSLSSWDMKRDPPQLRIDNALVVLMNIEDRSIQNENLRIICKGVVQNMITKDVITVNTDEAGIRFVDNSLPDIGTTLQFLELVLRNKDLYQIESNTIERMINFVENRYQEEKYKKYSYPWQLASALILPTLS